MNIGIQLFGFLRGLEGDILTHLERLPQAGITEVEPCVATVAIPGLENVIWPLDFLEENAAKIRAMGLEIRSVHYVAGDLDASAQALKTLAEKTGIRRYVLKTPGDMTPETLRAAAESYRAFADLLAPLGVTVLLHNEAADIRTRVNGTSAYEMLLDLCQGKVTAQVDVGWVRFGGQDEVAFLQRNEDRVRSLHYKDFPAAAQEPVDVTIGTGCVDTAACLAFALRRGLPHYIDQERFGPDRAGDVARLVSDLKALV